MPNGICKLTRKRGRFVRSHLIPKAFTYPGPEGLPFYQGASGHYVVRRWDSWYDSTLVTAEGETLLRDMDDWAVRFLRGERLVWSGWGPMTALGSYHGQIPGTKWGLRAVKVPEPDRLRAFFLSLLWRAAASNLKEFGEIELPDSDLDYLRQVVLGEAVAPMDFYPAALTQLSTRGAVHNHAPLADEKYVPSSKSSAERTIPIFRFYFDGLIVHFHRHARDDGYTSSIRHSVVGQGDELIVTTVPYQISYQRENLALVMAESLER